MNAIIPYDKRGSWSKSPANSKISQGTVNAAPTARAQNGIKQASTDLTWSPTSLRGPIDPFRSLRHLFDPIVAFRLVECWTYLRLRQTSVNLEFRATTLLSQL
jgi:hypothetical protein